MAIQTVTLQPVAKSVNTPETGNAWTSWDYDFDTTSYDPVVGIDQTRSRYVAYLFELPDAAINSELRSVNVQIYGTSSSNNLIVSLVQGSSPNGTVIINSDEVEIQKSQTADYNITFSTATTTSKYVTVIFNPARYAAVYGRFNVYMPLLSCRCETADPLSVTAVAPKSVTRDGGEAITFSWSVSGTYGTQNRAELQYSSDNANWSSLGNVNGSGTTFTKSSAFFAPGTVYWRVRVRSTYSLYSEWSSTVSFTVRYSATSYVVPLNSPTGGNVNAAEPITFAGTLLANGVPYQPFTVTAATFYWRSREADPYTQVSMTPSGANASVTIPGGTFPSGTVYWYISATDNLSATTQTDVYTISTLASRIDASPVAPVGVIEAENTPTTFTWRYATITGSEQKAAQLQYSTDGGDTWLTLGSVTGTATSYTAPANALPSGTITWRVRAENAADEWGEWSDPVSYVNFGAPDVTSVLTDGKPYATITWQVNTQSSYKLFVDGVQIGPYHGEDVRSYTLTQPLADGQHTVQVQVQNEYSQWSPINGTVFDALNTPTASVHLRHRTAVDVALSWTGGDGTGDFYVYRDGVPIAHTGGMEHVDRVALGSHEYYVIEKLASGDYNRSNTLTATPDVECPMIALLAGGAWLPLALSTNSERLIQISDEVRTAERFMLGADFPVVTIGRHRSRRVSLDAAWLRSSCQNDEFVALLGKPVILKLPQNGVIIGVLPAYAQSSAHFTSGYTYTLSQADWRDYIDNA